MKINLSFLRKCKPALNVLAVSSAIALGASHSIAQTACADDHTLADFNAGTTTNTYVTEMSGGGVILKPSAAAEFFVLPPADEWNSYTWDEAGSSTVSGGQLIVDAARFNTEPESTTFGPGTSLDFVATFAAASFQHIGFGAGTDVGGGAIYNAGPWAMFSTGTDGAQLYARTHNGSGDAAVGLGSEYLGSPHHYRIEWTTAGEVNYYIDGSLVYTETTNTVTTPMRPAISDYAPGGDVVTVDWIHASPYSSSGTFESRVFDRGRQTAWGTVSIAADVPAGTTLSIDIRTGDTPTPDDSWTAFTPVSDGDDIPAASRYIQYRATLETTDQTITPELKSFLINDCSTCTVKAQLTQQNLSCNGANDGSITVNVTKGTPPYQYKLKNGDYQSEPVFSNLKAKTYTVMVMDANGCTKSYKATLTAPPPVTVSITEQTNVCPGTHKGSATVSASGGSGTGYQYKLGKDGVYSENNVFDKLKAGQYKVFAKDDAGCTGSVLLLIESGCENIVNGIAGSDNINSTELKSNSLTIKLTPNPSASGFTLMLAGNSKEEVHIKVTDMFGRNIYKATGPAGNLYRFGNEFAPGMYILQVTQGSRSENVKIIKQ